MSKVDKDFRKPEEELLVEEKEKNTEALKFFSTRNKVARDAYNLQLNVRSSLGRWAEVDYNDEPEDY